MRLAGVLLGTLLVIMIMPGAPVQTVAQQNPNVLRYIGFSPTPPGDKLECRQAIAYALNREAIASALSAQRLLGTGTPAYSIQSPRLLGYDASIRWPSYDPAKARESYAQCAWQDPLIITGGASTNAFQKALHQALQDSFRTALAVRVDVQEADFNTMLSQISAGRLPVYSSGWIAVPQDFGYPSMPLGIAYDHIQDPEVRDLVSKRDGPATEKMLLQKMWIIPILTF
jgi:ABC-type transport system substrate-binding protein